MAKEFLLNCICLGAYAGFSIFLGVPVPGSGVRAQLVGKLAVGAAGACVGAGAVIGLLCMVAVLALMLAVITAVLAALSAAVLVPIGGTAYGGYVVYTRYRPAMAAQ